MKAVEARLRDVQEKTQKAFENISTLPPEEHMMTILAQQQSYDEIERYETNKRFSNID